jgi:hypothetical protein
VSLLFTKPDKRPESCAEIVNALHVLSAEGGVLIVDERSDAQKLREDGSARVVFGSLPDPVLREALTKLEEWGLAEQLTPRPVSKWKITLQGYAVAHGKEPWPKPEPLPEVEPARTAPRDKPMSDVGASGHHYATGPGRYVSGFGEEEDPECTIEVGRLSA